MSAPAVQNPASPAQAAPKNPTTIVGSQVRTMLERGTLHLPDDYSAENALKSAWLILQSVQDMNKNAALQVCTQESVINSLLDMVVQGLNPAKKQCYFIVYGKTLSCQRSYFGDMALAERLKPGIEIYHGVVYEGDEFKFETIRGRKSVVKHVQELENQNKSIKGVYCGVVDTMTGEDLGAEIMTMDQIERSWAMSKTYKPDGKGTHQNFPDQMALRTVIRRRCKSIINASSDALLLESVRRSEADVIEAEMEEEVSTHANGETLALTAPPQEVPVTQPQPAEQKLPTTDPGF